MTAPCGIAQQAVIEAALRDAGACPQDVCYVETHGTGTSLGDPIEFSALRAALGGGSHRSSEGYHHPLVLGALKTNLGHLEGAAGLAGLIKTVLVLEHGQAPPNLHLTRLNPRCSFSELDTAADDFPVCFPSPESGCERLPDGCLAGISSFGFGGTNAHAIISAAPVDLEARSRRAHNRSKPQQRKVAFLFTGQGSQYRGMGQVLYWQ